MSLIQCILISIINCFAGSGTSPWGGVLAKYLLQRPFIGGLIVGLITGDVTKGIAVGVAMQIVYIGYMNVGGVSSIDLGTVSFACVGLAVASNLDTAEAIALSTGIATLSNSFIILCRNVIYTFAGNVMKKGCEEANEKKIWWGYEGIVILGTILERFIPCFLLLYFGPSAVDALFAALPANVINAIGVVGKWLPCIGMAAMLVYLANDIWGILIFVMGFAEFGYLGLNATSIIFFAIGYAYLVYKSSGNKELAVVNKNDNDDDEEIL